MIKNNELIKIISDDIRDNPSTLIEDVIRDENFINLFEGKSNHEIRGIIYEYPQNQNIFASVLYDRVISKGVVEGLEAVEKFKVFRREDLKYASNWYRLATDIKETKDFNPTASPIPTSESRKGVAYSNEPLRKLVEFTFSNEQLATAFESETGLSELLASEMKSVRDTINIYINEVIRTELEKTDTTSGALLNFKQFDFDSGSDEYLAIGDYFRYDYDLTILKDYRNTFDGTGDESIKQKTYLKEIVDLLKIRILNDLDNLAEPSRDYNIGDSDGGFMRNLPKGEGILIINSRLKTLNDLYGNFKLEDYFKEVITINDYSLDGEKDVMIAYTILDKNAIEYRIMLDKTLNWNNPKGLYTNYFTHIWLGVLINPFVNALSRTFSVA